MDEYYPVLLFLMVYKIILTFSETNWVIPWIEIYPVDSAIHVLNNWGQYLTVVSTL